MKVFVLQTDAYQLLKLAAWGATPVLRPSLTAHAAMCSRCNKCRAGGGVDVCVNQTPLKQDSAAAS
jgi:hypothetical protein